ncbi:MAG: sigma-70 family RNA polymerase sigma factor [Pirellulaceae bacterium]
MNSTSESLLARLEDSNDSDAWNRFVELYTPLIFYWARRSGLQVSDASDLVQEVMAIVSQAIKRFQYDRGKSFRGWLRTITVNQFRQKWRRAQRTKITSGELSLLAAMPDRRTLESTWDRSYRFEILQRAIAGMRPDFAEETWDALMEFLKGQRTAKEIANEQNISVWTLYAAKSRMLKRLRNELNDML